jgi:HlyD family secretion protein
MSSGVIEEGAMVRQRQELIKLPDVSQMLAEIKIQESRVRQVQAGMPAFVVVETLPGRRFQGSVRKVGILPDSQSSWANPNVKVYLTEVLIEDELPELKPGVSIRAEIIITNLPNVLSVPIQAVATLKGTRVCFVRKGSSIVHVPVTIGWSNDRFVEIKSGLKEHDFVLLAAEGEPEEPEEENPDGTTNQIESAETNTVPTRSARP